MTNCKMWSTDSTKSSRDRTIRALSSTRFVLQMNARPVAHLAPFFVLLLLFAFDDVSTLIFVSRSDELFGVAQIFAIGATTAATAIVPRKTVAHQKRDFAPLFEVVVLRRLEVQTHFVHWLRAQRTFEFALRIGFVEARWHSPTRRPSNSQIFLRDRPKHLAAMQAREMRFVDMKSVATHKNSRNESRNHQNSSR